MGLKNIVIVVKDIKESVQFYHDMFGLHVILDGGDNVMLTEGLVLQSAGVWKEQFGSDVSFYHNASVLYFEEPDLEAFLSKLDRARPSVRYVTKLTDNSWGRRMIRIYDPDGHLIEVSERKRTEYSD